MVHCIYNSILDPYFVEDYNKNPVTENLLRYRERIITPFLRIYEETIYHYLWRFCHARNLLCTLCMQWFQQEKVTCHVWGIRFAWGTSFVCFLWFWKLINLPWNKLPISFSFTWYYSIWHLHLGYSKGSCFLKASIGNCRWLCEKIVAWLK